jgi:hypothetical protein
MLVLLQKADYMLLELQGKVVKLKDTMQCTNYKQGVPNKRSF